MGPFEGKPIRAIAVDIPVLSIPTDTPVFMGRNRRPPLLFADIADIMRDLYALEFNIPIFFIIDAQVDPYNMTVEEEAYMRHMESAPPHDLERIWRMRPQRFGFGYKVDEKSRFREKADAAICELVNKRDVAVISGDGFGTEARTGKLQRPEDLVRFQAKRSSRELPFAFLNRTERLRGLSLHDVVAPLSNDEYWDEWEECARILAGHMGREQKRSDREWISHVQSNRVSDGTELITGRDEPATTESGNYSEVKGGPKSHVATEEAVLPHSHEPEQSSGITSDPSHTIPRLVPDAAFVFRDLRDLRAHQGMTVEMVSRPFRVGEQLFFKLYAAGMGVLVELTGDQVITTDHHFVSATGRLELDNGGWVLRDASINGVVSAAEVEELKSLGRRLDPPTFTPWGRLPRWRWRRQQHDQSVEEHLSGPDTETEVDQPRPNPEPKPPETVNPVGESSTDSGTPPGPTSTPPTPPKVPAETTPENADTSAPASTTPSRIDSNGQAEPTAEETDLPAPDVDDETESPESVRGPDGDNEPEGETEPRDHRRLVMAGVAVGVAIALVVPFRILTNDGAGKSAATPAGAPFGAGGSRAMHTH